MITLTCDLCGREISDGQPYVELDVTACRPKPKRWRSGWLAHYHYTEGGEHDCYHRLEDLVQLVREQAGFLRDIPVASEPEINFVDRDAAHPATHTDATSLHNIGLPPRAAWALHHHGIKTLGDAMALTDDELLDLEGVGIKSLDVIRTAASVAQTSERGK